MHARDGERLRQALETSRQLDAQPVAAARAILQRDFQNARSVFLMFSLLQDIVSVDVLDAVAVGQRDLEREDPRALDGEINRC